MFTILTRYRLSTFAVAAMLAICSTADAQHTDSIAHSEVLDDITVTDAARRKQLATTAPVRTLDSEAMLRLGVTDIADALHRLPGITLRDYGGAGA